MKDKIYKLQGKVQHYEWGGFEFIPSLIGFDNSGHKPCAEYWMGAHPSASAVLMTEQGGKSWYELIQKSPIEQLAQRVKDRFGELPYLFKVLDVNKMLSIQVHPTKEEARKGFEKEEAAGVLINAGHRNYKDKNHKPEVMVALGEFWLLHGFKKEDQLEDTLQSVPEFNFLSKIFSEQGYYALYKTVMEMGQKDVDKLLLPVIKKEISAVNTKDKPGYWVSKLYNGNLPSGNVDKGVFSIYFFNIVRLKKGEGIFQGPGVPHAYLEGQNVELMANSDNVLRGGLTSKHIDVPELLKHTVFEGIEPQVLGGCETGAEVNYPIPVEDFGISAIQLQKGDKYNSKSESAEVFIVMQGEVACGTLTCKRGEAFVVLPDVAYTISTNEVSQLYKAFVP